MAGADERATDEPPVEDPIAELEAKPGTSLRDAGEAVDAPGSVPLAGEFKVGRMLAVVPRRGRTGLVEEPVCVDRPDSGTPVVVPVREPPEPDQK